MSSLKDVDTSKNEELYKYSKDVLDEEFQRFKKIDEKATRYLTILTAVIGIYVLLGRQTFASLIPPENCIQLITLIFGIATMLSFLYSGHLLFSIIKLHEIKKPPLDNDIFNYFNENELNSIFYGLAWNNKLAFEKNKLISNEKTKILSESYKAIAISVFLLIFFVTSSGINEWNNDTTNLPTNITLNKEKV